MVIYALAVSTTPSSVLIRLWESVFDSSMSSVGEAARFLLTGDDDVVTSTSTFSLALSL